MLYPECQISYQQEMQRSRILPAPGQVIRRVGDHVTSDSLVAEADVPSMYRLIELSKALGTRVADATKVMVKQVGDRVQAGELIARTGTLFKAKCFSPVRGEILDARGDKVLIKAVPQHVALTALYPGQVVNLIPEWGVVIKVSGALIQGVWGIGEEQRARLESMVEQGDAALEASQITAVHMGMVLLGGRTLTREVMDAAIEHQVRGIVVGSMSSELLPALRSSSLSVMLTEGFGDMPMNSDSFSLLHSYAGREVCLCPPRHTRWETRRAELIVPMPARDRQPEVQPRGTLSSGTRVRILRAPHEGMLGRVTIVPEHSSRFESGIVTRGAEVELDSGDRVLIPLQNIEIIQTQRASDS